MPLQYGTTLPCTLLPDSHRKIFAGTGKDATIITERNRSHLVGMSGTNQQGRRIISSPGPYIAASGGSGETKNPSECIRKGSGLEHRLTEG